MFGYSKEAVRVKVKKCEGKLQPELRKFSVDPQITSIEVLQSILIKAFDIKSDFNLSYRSVDDVGQEIYLPLLSDWELDAAFLKAHNVAVTQRSEPCVQLKVDMKTFSEATENWDPTYIEPSQSTMPPIQSSLLAQTPIQKLESDKLETQSGFQGLFLNQMEKTFNMVSRALNLYEDPNTPPRAPLSDVEFRTFLDAVGQITNTMKLREVIYCGGIDPSLRKVVWKHILNVYPEGMTGKQRMDYIKRKANEYYSLKARWKDCIHKGMVNSDLTYVTSMVKKDVLRTDRHHAFYAGSDDNQNIASLFNILTTYALNHPTVSYCQGMSDLASPLLVTMGDEAHAYICLCALMMRLHPNFLLDGEAMTLKFSHLSESLQVYDPEFYNYLKIQQADDLLFCYRWLLLEMKREFAFDDALRMLEVLWASLPQRSPNYELRLIEKEFDPTIEMEDGDPPPLSPLVKTQRENAYTKVCAIRRQSSSFSLANVKAPKLSTCKPMNYSLDDNVTRHDVVNSSLQHTKEFQSLDDAAVQLQHCTAEQMTENVVSKYKNRTPDLKTNPRNKCSENGRLLKPQNSTSSWSSAGNLSNGNTQDIKDTPLGNQIRLLRDKISMHNKKFFSSLEKLDSSTECDVASKSKVKMIKNLNEFLHFATGNKTSLERQDKLARAHSVIVKTSPNKCPTITFSKTSFDESDIVTRKEYKDHKISIDHSKPLETDANDSSPDDSQEYYPMTTSMTRELNLELEHLDRHVFGSSYLSQCSTTFDTDSSSTDDKRSKATHDNKKEINTKDTVQTHLETPHTLKLNSRSIEDIYVWENPLHRNTPVARIRTNSPQTPDEQAEIDFDCDNGEIIQEHSEKESISEPDSTDVKQSYEASVQNKSVVKEDNDKEIDTPTPNTSKSHKFFSNMSQELENAKKNCETLLNTKQSNNLQSVATTITNFQRKYEAFKPPNQKNVYAPSDISSKTTIASLPPPTAFGAGNPFLMFLCLTVLMQHRDYIMRNHMDYNELAMHFDKMVRKHNVNRVLNQARQMYAIYLKQQTQRPSDVTTT